MIYCNTNYVTMNFVANAILAVGDAPAMTEFEPDAKILASLANATYINLGTMTTDRVSSIPESAKAALEHGKPWVLDPVAVGLGLSHDKVVQTLKQTPPTVIRGNSSEIIALAKLWDLGVETSSDGPSGVESTDSVEQSLESAVALAKFINGAVAVSGEVDLITDGTEVIRMQGGSAMMTKITGAGCSLGGVVARYVASNPPFLAAQLASKHYNLASERAEEKASGNGSFQVHFLDELSKITVEELMENI